MMYVVVCGNGIPRRWTLSSLYIHGPLLCGITSGERIYVGHKVSLLPDDAVVLVRWASYRNARMNDPICPPRCYNIPGGPLSTVIDLQNFYVDTLSSSVHCNKVITTDLTAPKHVVPNTNYEHKSINYQSARLFLFNKPQNADRQVTWRQTQWNTQTRTLAKNKHIPTTTRREQIDLKYDINILYTTGFFRFKDWSNSSNVSWNF